MKKIKKRLEAIFASLKLTDKAKTKTGLDSDDWTNVNESYKKAHGKSLYEDIKAEEASAEEAAEDAEKAAHHDTALALLNKATDETIEGEEATQQAENAEQAAVVVTAKLEKVEAENTEMRTIINKVDNQEVPEMKIVVGVTGIGMKHTNTHLFGVKDPIYAVDARWNSMYLNPLVANSMAEASKAEQERFSEESSQFAQNVAMAIKNLHVAGQLNPILLREASNPNLDALVNAGLGEQFVQYRVRELIARIFELESVTNIFPTRSGVQDRDIITNAFIGELTQAWQDSETSLKGSSVLDPELGYVDDCMILSKFGAYKTLEREYIAYLNTNGSSPVKWSMIEWVMEKYMIQAMNEQNERYVRGIFAKPATDVAGHYLNASTGVLNRIFLYNTEKKVALFDDAALYGYANTGTQMVDYLEYFADLLIEKLNPLGIKPAKVLTIFVNDNHRHWYRAQYRTKYNLNLDFDGVFDAKLQDSNIKLTWVPNMGSLAWAFASPPGNIQTIEHIPGEMFSVYFERRLNNVYVQSTWKEGSAAGFAGQLVTTQAELDAAAHLNKQWIWAPKPQNLAGEDDTTLDGTLGPWHGTIANTGAINITNIADAEVGVMYTIECTSLTNASTVNKATNFDQITANFVPTALGDRLVVVLVDAKFYEVCRVVNQVLSYNALIAPNAIGVR